MQGCRILRIASVEHKNGSHFSHKQLFYLFLGKKFFNLGGISWFYVQNLWICESHKMWNYEMRVLTLKKPTIVNYL